jgi:NAD-specific glutamate dehydrogenase
LALGRTFPDRPTILLYLYWEPLNAERFEEFCRHRAETAELTDAVREARVSFDPQSLEAMWQEWAARGAPSWLADHVHRLRARYGVSIPAMKHL